MVKTYSSLDDFYIDAENHNGIWIYETNLNKRLSDLLFGSEGSDLKEKIEFERLVMNFSIQIGEITPACSSTSKDGKVFQYPDYSSLSDNGFEYLKLRSETVKNPYLIVKYNHVLWGSPKKHKKYAERAIDTYFKLFVDLLDNDQVSIRSKVSVLENLIVISFQADYRVDDAKNLLFDVLFKDDFWKYGWRISIIDFMLNQKWFKQDDFNNVPKLLGSISQEAKKNKDYSKLERSLETALRVAKRLNQPELEIKRQLGEYCELFAESERDDNTFLIQNIYLAQALSYFDSINDIIASERVSVKLVDVRNKLKLAKITTEPEDITHLVKLYQEWIDKVLEMPPNAIYLLLSENHPLIFPSLDKLKKESEGRLTRFCDFFNLTEFDINSNVSKPDQNDEQKRLKDLRQRYEGQMNFVSVLFLLPLFSQGQQRDIITYETLRDFLFKNTWLGQSLEENRSGEKLSFNWMEMLAPALQELFKQLELHQKTHQNNATLVMDSLTLKFEGMFRDFAEVLRIKTVKANRKKSLEIREMYIEDYLANPKMQELFDENDRMFFNYLFFNTGMNLRNKIAHSFYRLQDYSLSTSILLLLAVLRLSKYRFMIKETVKSIEQ